MGYHDVDALLDHMTPQQIKEWAAYFRVKNEMEEGRMLEGRAQFNLMGR